MGFLYILNTFYFLILVQIPISEGIPPLRCCTLVEEPIVYRDENGIHGFDGLAIEYYKKLMEKSSLKCKGPIEDFSKIMDGNDTGFTAFVYRMENCTSENGLVKDLPECKCDIGLAGFGLNKDRLGRVEYLPPFAFDRYSALTPSSNLAQSSGDAFFLTTFSYDVWFCIFGLVVCFTILKMLDRRFARMKKKKALSAKDQNSCLTRRKQLLLNRPVLYRLRYALESTFFRMILQPSPGIQGDHNSTRQRVLNFTISLVGLFFVLTYEATMTASLLSEEQQSILRGVEDLKNCRVHPKDVCIPTGGAVEEYWKEAIVPKLKNSCKSGFGDVQNAKSYGELSEMVASGKCMFGVALKANLNWAASNTYCGKVELVGKPFFNTGLSFVLPKGSPYLDELSRATLALRNHDSIPSPDQYISQNVGSCQSQSRPFITLGKLRIFFILSYAVVFAIFLEMVIDPQSVPEEGADSNGDIESGQSAGRGKEMEGDDYNTLSEGNASSEDAVSCIPIKQGHESRERRM